MVSASSSSIRVLSRSRTLGPSTQSVEIRNDSKKQVTVYLEKLGSEHFSIPDSCQKLTVKPGASARVQVKFQVPEKGIVMTLSATYRAMIKVWVLKKGKGAKKELVDMFDVTGSGPGCASLDTLHCFDPTGSRRQYKAGRRTP